MHTKLLQGYSHGSGGSSMSSCLACSLTDLRASSDLVPGRLLAS